MNVLTSCLTCFINIAGISKQNKSLQLLAYKVEHSHTLRFRRPEHDYDLFAHRLVAPLFANIAAYHSHYEVEKYNNLALTLMTERVRQVLEMPYII